MARLRRPRRLGRHRRGIGHTGRPSDPPWAKAHSSIAQDEDGQEAAQRAFGDWEERLRMVAAASDRASDALEPDGPWNAYVRAIAGFMSGMRPEKISATDYLAYDEASTGRNWHLPLGYGTLVAAACRLRRRCAWPLPPSGST